MKHIADRRVARKNEGTHRQEKLNITVVGRTAQRTQAICNDYNQHCNTHILRSFGVKTNLPHSSSFSFENNAQIATVLNILIECQACLKVEGNHYDNLLEFSFSYTLLHGVISLS